MAASRTTYRSYECEDDFWRMRAFLRQVFLLNDALQRSWHVARLDYARYHSLMNCAKMTLEEVTTLWEADGEIVAILMPDGGLGEAHLLVHPSFKSEALEEEMICVAETRLCEPTAGGGRKLRIWSPEADPCRQELLARRGYIKSDWAEHQWRRRLDQPVQVSQPASGYTVRSLGDGLELLERCYASGLGFHQGDIGIAVENRLDSTWYRNIQIAPTYRRDLDIVAIAPDGAIAAFCTIWFDDVTRSAYYEPVATVPQHQKKGLGRAVMTEGLRRLQRMGCVWASVSGGSLAANALYQSVIGPEYELYESWVREW